MKLKEYKKTTPRLLRQVSLCFLIRDNKVLLAMKKRGFGAGKWNGIGGKVSNGETLEEACAREAQEEIGVTNLRLKKVAILDFYFPHVPLDKNWNQQVHVFLCKDWEGEPAESEEVKPQWFSLSEIPYEDMWSDDKYWLPRVLEGERIQAECMFDKNEGLAEFNIKAGL